MIVVNSLVVADILNDNSPLRVVSIDGDRLTVYDSKYNVVFGINKNLVRLAK